MSLRKRGTVKLKKFSLPVDYRLLSDGLYDSKNVFDNKGITETRHGIALFNSTSLGGQILSGSYYKNSSGTRYRIVKVGTTLYRVNASGAATALKTGLTSSTKHRGYTIQGRHIILIEGDGLFSFDGTTFTQLGQSVPSAPSVAASGSGNSLSASTYQVACTFYASTIGFETNLGTASSSQAIASGEKLDISSIPSTAANALINKVRIYLKDITNNGDWTFWAEIDLGTTTNSITTDPTSTTSPPETHATPPASGKYGTPFGQKFAITGVTANPNDVFISEDYLPDAYADGLNARTLKIEGQGPNTGIAQGLYNNSVLDPYLIIFTKTSTTLYSEIGGMQRQVVLDDKIGCVSNDTIQVHNGDVYFMSENGFFKCSNGRLEALGEGAINDIFSRSGWNYEVNKSQFSNFFSCYYSTLGHYSVFVAEGSNTSFNKAYNYELALKGFRPLEFQTSFTCAFAGEDSSGNQCVYLGDTTGALFEYSIENPRHDEDKDGNSLAIETFMILPPLEMDDYNSTYNFRDLLLKALASDTAIQVRVFRNYNIQDVSLLSYEFSNPNSGFVLDVSKLDEGVFGEDRVPVPYVADLNTTAETILIGFYQNTIDANIGLISGQLQYNKNGNRNQ